jgi:hypothetical protein
VTKTTCRAVIQRISPEDSWTRPEVVVAGRTAGTTTGALRGAFQTSCTGDTGRGGGIRWRREVPGDAGQSPRPATCPVRAVWQSCYPNLKLGFECVNSDLNQTQMGSGLSNCVIEGCLYWS